MTGCLGLTSRVPIDDSFVGLQMFLGTFQVKQFSFKVSNYFMDVETDKSVIVSFQLPPGSFATIFLREVMKETYIEHDENA